MEDELLDIVNEHDQVIGQKYRSEVYQHKMKNFRAINAFLINDQQQVWIPRRVETKTLFPSCLDASVGGHVGAGESYEVGFKRELNEELNIKASEVDHRFVAKLTPYTQNVSAFMHLYVIVTNKTPDYNRDDFSSASWYTIAEVQHKITHGELAKDDLPALLNVVQQWLI